MNVQEIEINVVFHIIHKKIIFFKSKSKLIVVLMIIVCLQGFRQPTYIKKIIVKIAYSAKPNQFYEMYTQNTSEI